MSEIGLIRGLEVPEAPGQIRSLEIARGTPGASAYDIWRAQGNTGTEAQFLTSLRGPAGAASTVPGPQGPAGPAGPASTVPGPQGLSAYQVWLAAGNTGTQADFLNSLKGAPGTGGATQPRGTGGTPGRLTTRAASTATRTDLSPSSPAEAFDPGRVALIDADNRAIGRGQTGRVTGLEFVAGKRYYVEFPVGSGPNLAPVPDPLPAGWPTAAVSNVERRYYLAGEVYADGAELYFLHYADAGVELSDVAVPMKRLNVAGLAYDTDLITAGVFTRMVQGAAQNGAAPRLLAQGDAAHPATWTASPITKDIGGVQKPVQVKFTPFGENDYLYPNAWDAQLGGEILLEFQSDAGFDTSRPGVFFCSSGGMTAGTLGTQYRLKMYSGQVVIAKSTSDGRTIAADANVSAIVPITFSANELWNIRLKVDEATKKVYVRCWKTGTVEPTTWLIDGVAIPELTAGRWGFIARNGNNGVTRLTLAPNGVAASHV